MIFFRKTIERLVFNYVLLVKVLVVEYETFVETFSDLGISLNMLKRMMRMYELYVEK